VDEVMRVLRNERPRSVVNLGLLSGA
jgi:hypothetical protein